jgi:molecular chaperone DnaJ
MAMRDPYEVLGVPRNATEAEIKKAYRRLARKHHPDVNPGDASAQKKFQEIAAAWEVLKEPARRDRFDRTGEAGEAPPGAPGWAQAGRGPAGSTGFHWTGDFRDVFSDLFSGGGGGSPFEGDDDAAAELTIPFRDAVLGGTVSFRARVPRRCGRCAGTGRSGRSACAVCHGTGSVSENEKITVRIPAGVDSGSKIRVPGKGRTEQGDLYLSIQVEGHPYFRRDGDDIAAEVPVTVPEAYLGAEIEVPTIHGGVRAKIPAGTASGQRFRLKGKGVINARTASAGDHYYRITVLTPDVRTEGGRALVKEIAKLYAIDPRAGLPRGL